MFFSSLKVIAFSRHLISSLSTKRSDSLTDDSEISTLWPSTLASNYSSPSLVMVLTVDQNCLIREIYMVGFAVNAYLMCVA